MSLFQENLEKYAELAVKVGVNVQLNQTLVINTSIDQAEFIRLVVKNAYQAGAKNVVVNWNDDVVTRFKYDLAPDESFLEYPTFRAQEQIALAKEGAAFMSVISSSPDLLSGVDPKRIANFQKVSGEALEEFRQYIQSDKVSWTVIAAPSQAWAEKVFPDVDPSEQVDALWNAIFKAVRVDQEDPVAAWKTHDETLHEKADYLNDKNYTSLHYTAPGTDLTVDLPKGHIWCGAGSVSEDHVHFMANMPTEEVFTAPDFRRAEGTITSSKPLSYGGTVIDGMTFNFKDGEVVEVSAEQGEETLKALINDNKGSKSLGEVALVPHKSPISQSGIIFYNTLFDENASNHLALGQAYATSVQGGAKMDRDQLEDAGLNRSNVHVDFMVGNGEMNIDGIKEDGTVVPIFRNGEWAF